MQKVEGIYFCKSKSGLLMMFKDMPERSGSTWVGNNYVNSVAQTELEKMLEGVEFPFEREPEYIEFQLKF